MIKKKTKRNIKKTDEDEGAVVVVVYDEKEKLIQSHHLNIKTFPQTPLNCVSIQVFACCTSEH